jgi:hypothetical protein
MKGKLPILLFVVATAAGCTTYHAAGASGGFSETKLSDRLYQVRFQGNGYTSNDRVSVFILRRAAELTLEQGFRYFTVVGQQTQTSHSMGYNFANQSTMVRFLDDGNDPAAMDASMVIKNTDREAGGRLSPRAAAALKSMATPKQ